MSEGGLDRANLGISNDLQASVMQSGAFPGRSAKICNDLQAPFITSRRQSSFLELTGKYRPPRFGAPQPRGTSAARMPPPVIGINRKIQGLPFVPRRQPRNLQR